MIRQSTEEEEKEDDPFEVIYQRVTQRVGIEPILEYGRSDIGYSTEDDHTYAGELGRERREGGRTSEVNLP